VGGWESSVFLEGRWGESEEGEMRGWVCEEVVCWKSGRSRGCFYLFISFLDIEGKWGMGMEMRGRKRGEG
jgi:hypothetical protein